jgi:hypothetical protein
MLQRRQSLLLPEIRQECASGIRGLVRPIEVRRWL